MRSFLLFLPFIFIAATPFPSQACESSVDESEVILFIDTNDSEEEVRSARTAACQRGQRLEVIQADDERSVSENLENQLQDINRRGGSLENLTISGHNGGGMFSGESGSITKQDISEVFEDFPELKESLESLHLLGCYTAVPSEINDWKNIFPELKIVGGYDGSGPLSKRLAAQTYIEDMLSVEEDLIYSAEMEELREKIESGFRHIQYVNSAIYVEPVCNRSNEDAAYYYRQQQPSGERMITLDRSMCDSVINGENSKREEYEQALEEFYSGQREIPEETSGTLLREIYSYARQNSHCYQMFASHSKLSDPDALLMLLFFHDVKKNFGRYFDQNLDTPQLRDDLSSINVEDLEEKRSERVSELEEAVERRRREEEFLMKNGLENLPEQLNTLIERRRGNLSDEAKEFLRENPDYLEAGYWRGSFSNKEVLNELNHFKELHRDKQVAEENPEKFIDNYSSQTRFRENTLRSLKETSSESIVELKERVWMPSYENIQDKSREEISQNIHNLVELRRHLYDVGAEQQAQSLNQVTTDMERSLQYMRDLPFEWHEEMENPPPPYSY